MFLFWVLNHNFHGSIKLLIYQKMSFFFFYSELTSLLFKKSSIEAVAVLFRQYLIFFIYIFFDISLFCFIMVQLLATSPPRKSLFAVGQG